MIDILKFLEALVAPPMGAIILISCGLFIKPFRRRLVILGLAVLIITSMPITAFVLYRILEAPYKDATLETVPPAKTAVVLGGYLTDRLTAEGDINMTEAIDRLYKGKQALDAQLAEQLLLTGGNVYQVGTKRPEAQVAREVLINWGVSPDQILTEATSRTTMQNAQESYKMVDAVGKEILLITSASHMPRAMWAFKKVGFQPIALPADKSDIPPLRELLHWRYIIPSAGALRAVDKALHELSGRLVYPLLF